MTTAAQFRVSVEKGIITLSDMNCFDAVTNTRDLSRGLHRVDVDALGFIDALRDLGSELTIDDCAK